MNKSKCLILDIETSPLLVYVWELKDQYVGPNQIHTDWHIMAWAAKWLGDPDNKIIYRDLRNYGGKYPASRKFGKTLKQTAGIDRPILKPLWDLLNEADIVITQNGKEFDSRKINARFMLHGLPPPKPYAHHDTYQIVKKVASFTSNSLEYLTSKFCSKHKKTSHAKYSGLSLWVECLKGNDDAWNEMRKYNVEDVLSTEELYLKIRAWAPDSLPKIFDLTDTSQECGMCGYVGKMREGTPRKAKTYKYQQHSCPKCGSWQRGKRIP